MKILFTGASSFTGLWFVQELAEAGHEILATFRGKSAADYDGVRAERVRRAAEFARPVFEVEFGDERFLKQVVRESQVDVLCHHAAEVGDYRSPEFDVARALGKNTRNLATVLRTLREQGCRAVLLTGSVFEGGEGAGSDDLPHFSPYGLSKALTAEVFRHFAAEAGLWLGKFVIPNPFGPYEEPRFTTYLARTWLKGEEPGVRTPAYVRDNIHVSLLAKAYSAFVGRSGSGRGFERVNPSGYVESQGSFARRFADEMAPRLGIACPVSLAEQTEFEEPRVRINTDPVDRTEIDWSESAAWDALADYYRAALGRSGAA